MSNKNNLIHSRFLAYRYATPCAHLATMEKITDVVVVKDVACSNCGNADASNFAQELGILVCGELCLDEYVASEHGMPRANENKLELVLLGDANGEGQVLAAAMPVDRWRFWRRRSEAEKAAVQRKRDAKAEKDAAEAERKAAAAKRRAAEEERRLKTSEQFAEDLEIDVSLPWRRKKSPRELELEQKRREAEAERRLARSERGGAREQRKAVEEAGKKAKAGTKTAKAQQAEKKEQAKLQTQYSVQAILQANGIHVEALSYNSLRAHSAVLDFSEHPDDELIIRAGLEALEHFEASAGIGAWPSFMRRDKARRKEEEDRETVILQDLVRIFEQIADEHETTVVSSRSEIELVAKIQLLVPDSRNDPATNNVRRELRELGEAMVDLIANDRVVLGDKITALADAWVKYKGLRKPEQRFNVEKVLAEFFSSLFKQFLYAGLTRIDDARLAGEGMVWRVVRGLNGQRLEKRFFREELSGSAQRSLDKERWVDAESHFETWLGEQNIAWENASAADLSKFLLERYAK